MQKTGENQYEINNNSHKMPHTHAMRTADVQLRSILMITRIAVIVEQLYSRNKSQHRA